MQRAGRRGGTVSLRCVVPAFRLLHGRPTVLGVAVARDSLTVTLCALPRQIAALCPLASHLLFSRSFSQPASHPMDEEPLDESALGPEEEDDEKQTEASFDDGNDEQHQQQYEEEEAQRELHDDELEAAEQQGALEDGGEEREEFDDEAQLRGLDSQQLAYLAAEAAAAAEEDAQADADAAANGGPYDDEDGYGDAAAEQVEQEAEDMRHSQADLDDGGGAQDANFGEEEEQALGDDEQQYQQQHDEQEDEDDHEQQQAEEDAEDDPTELPPSSGHGDDVDAELDPNVSPPHRSKVSFSAAPRIEIAPEAEYVSTPASIQASPTHAAAAAAAATTTAPTKAVTVEDDSSANGADAGVAVPAAAAPAAAPAAAAAVAGVPDRAAVVPVPAAVSVPVPVARLSSTVRSSVPVSSRPPLPQSELDSLRHRFLGLRVITAGKIDLRVEGEEGKHWVRAEALPMYSENNCEKYEVRHVQRAEQSGSKRAADRARCQLTCAFLSLLLCLPLSLINARRFAMILTEMESSCG